MDYCKEYEKWCDNADYKDVLSLKQMSDEEIEDSFYRTLEFGTGGLRGVMGIGTNRMNAYVVKQATQGLANEISDLGDEAKNKGVVIAYDSRNNSAFFAKEAAKVLCANGIKTYLFDELRPTPELSFAVRYLGCVRGIVITASHNPKEYNGYKVYGEDGGQIPPTVANKIIKYISSCDIFSNVKYEDTENYIVIGKEVDEAYLNAVHKQSMGIIIPEAFKVIYTPLHGSGNKLVRSILSRIGAKNVFVVPEQEKPDGNFSTVKSPNPENAEAFNIAIEYARKMNADLVFGTDPDSDRIGVVVKTENNDFKVLTGNETGILLCEFILRKLKENGNLDNNYKIIKTIVTTEIISKISGSYEIETLDVLTGFKYIGEKIKEFETDKKDKFLFGLEESYGYLKGTYARDKDAVVAAMLICEMAADYKRNGMTLYDGLISIFKKYGYSYTRLFSKTYTGIEGSQKIEAIMKKLRNGEIPIDYETVIDYNTGVDGLPKSNVLKYYIENGWFAVRPSGTEPKIKIYFEFFGNDAEKNENTIGGIVESMFGEKY